MVSEHTSPSRFSPLILAKTVSPSSIAFLLLCSTSADIAVKSCVIVACLLLALVLDRWFHGGRSDFGNVLVSNQAIWQWTSFMPSPRPQTRDPTPIIGRHDTLHQRQWSFAIRSGLYTTFTCKPDEICEQPQLFPKSIGSERTFKQIPLPKKEHFFINCFAWVLPLPKCITQAPATAEPSNTHSMSPPKKQKHLSATATTARLVHTIVPRPPKPIPSTDWFQSQKFSGGGYGLTTKIPATAFKITSGSPKIYEADNGSGRLMHRESCVDCGGPILEYAVCISICVESSLIPPPSLIYEVRSRQDWLY